MVSMTVVPKARQDDNLDINKDETADLIRQAQESDAADKLLTIRQALRKYPKAVFWATLLSTSLIMEGYDLVIVREPDINCWPFQL